MYLSCISLKQVLKKAHLPYLPKFFTAEVAFP
jgi:hypothetical protein